MLLETCKSGFHINFTRTSWAWRFINICSPRHVCLPKIGSQTLHIWFSLWWMLHLKHSGISNIWSYKSNASFLWAWWFNNIWSYRCDCVEKCYHKLFMHGCFCLGFSLICMRIVNVMPHFIILCCTYCIKNHHIF